MARTKRNGHNNSAATVGFAEKLRAAAVALRNNMDAGDYNARHPDLRADFILANPPFNVSEWVGQRLRDDKRWQYGAPPAGNANFARAQHIAHHLAPAGVAGFVLGNGSMSCANAHGTNSIDGGAR